MEVAYQPYIDPEYESLFERIHPARVCIDNETYQDCTLVKVDSANKQGILLEMVQVLTDLDLVISKSYISSDGGWFMDVFHVTDQLGTKLTDESLMLYIKQALCATKHGGLPKELNFPRRKDFKSRHISTDHTVLEMTAVSRPGLLSEISAVLAELACHIASAVVWTHHKRAAFIIYVEDETRGGPITDPNRLAHIQEQLENVEEAHHMEKERWSVRLTTPTAGRTHSERRLHQLMFADKDYEQCYGGCQCGGAAGCMGVHVSIEGWEDKGYSVVNVKSRDRPKLLFDTVCVLTELDYVVFHAAVCSLGSTANQEYFIRHKDGYTLDEDEKHKLAQCLVAAIERRVTKGLRLDVSTQNRSGLLSTMTRVFRENGLSITRVEIGTRGERAIGSFYVTDASGQDINLNIIDSIRKEIGGSLVVVNSNKSSGWNTPQSCSSRSISRSASGSSIDEKPRLSFGSLIWSHIERFSGNFGPIKL